MAYLAGICYNKNRLEKTPIFSSPNQITFNGGESKMTVSDYKTCKSCNQSKPLTSFSKGHNNCCVCNKKAFKARNPERYLEQKRMQTWRARARKAGISLEEYLNQREAREQRIKADKARIKVRKCQHSKCPVLSKNPKIDYKVNREYQLRRCKAYYDANREKAVNKVLRWKKNNPAKRSAQDFRRRTKLANTVKDLTNEQWEAIKSFYNFRCAYCGMQKKLTLDHVIPIAKGGHHTASNIVPACQSCNSSKRDRLRQPAIMHNIV